MADVREQVSNARSRGLAVTFVPTMGALHAGHASLMHAAAGQGRFLVVSIFVNPLQFNDADDLVAYPRTAHDDESLCSDSGVDLVWRPEVETVYPPGFDTTIEPGQLASGLEGLHRPGHFGGMATVVLKLLNVVTPDIAFFGRKDFQQLAIVRRMVRDLNVPVRVVGCPTVREADGLALSSRNVKLSKNGRALAVNLSRVIKDIALALRSDATTEDALRAGLQDLTSYGGIDVDYLEVVDRDTLVALKGRDVANAVVVVAAMVEGVRLIDNVELQEPDESLQQEGQSR